MSFDRQMRAGKSSRSSRAPGAWAALLARLSSSARLPSPDRVGARLRKCSGGLPSLGQDVSGFLIPARQNTVMLQAATSETTAPCPRCRNDMVLAVVIPHPISSELARHTYLCGNCNQTKTYILPVGAPADGGANGDQDRTAMARGEPDDRRRDPRQGLTMPATIYEKDGSFLSCRARYATFRNPADAWNCSRKPYSPSISCFRCCRTEAAADCAARCGRLP